MHGSRTLPLALDEARDFGAAPGGGRRVVVAGERVVVWADGSMAASPDRLPGNEPKVLELPERLGGGFLFALGNRLFRSDDWLAPVAGGATLSGIITGLVEGLDRAYARTQQGALVGVDPRRAVPTDLGPVPASSDVVSVAALDAWRAVAIADERGAMITLDAGSTWRPLALPIDPTELVPGGGVVTVVGADAAHEAQRWEVRSDGQAVRAAPGQGAAAREASAAAEAEGPARALGPRPLATAVEDGWPLEGGTALVARDGVLGRVRLSDGAVVEVVPDAFPMRPARCHAVSLAREKDPGAVGFVCGEARGRTAVYRFDAAAGRLVELHAWSGPREVLASGNGALAARGACEDDPAGSPESGAGRGRDAAAQGDGDVAWCLMPPGGAWSEMHLRGDDVDQARLVVLADGRVALVRPPRGGDLSTARVTVTDGVRSTHVPIAWPQMRADAGRALRLGLWMDGFEERRPGVLGGWVDAAGAVLGVEIPLDGEARIGAYLRAAGDAYVSGRWGLGWMASRHGVETTDGGITWKDVELPEPIAPARGVRERACGPAGCVAAGWIRVGWGDPEKVEPRPAPTAWRAPGGPRISASVVLDCSPLASRPPEPRAAAPARPSRPAPAAPVLRASGRFGTLVLSPLAVGGEPLPSFLSHASPPVGPDDAGVSAEATGILVRGSGYGSFGRVYAWGPRGGDWEQLGRWQIRWLWPFGGWPDVRSSSLAPAPWTTMDAARTALAMRGSPQTTWSLAAGDDAEHALLVGRRVGSGVTAAVVALEADRAAVEVRRPGGEPFGDVEGATRVGGRWYVASWQSPGELAATVVWAVDGGVAREVARVPRVAAETRAPTRLARRADGRAVGLLVDGQPVVEGGPPVRWVVSVDVDSGATSDPQPLVPVDLSDRKVTPCTGEDGGWEVDVPYPGSVTVRAGDAKSLSMQSPVARMRLSRDRACVERLSGAIEPYAAQPPAGLTRGAGLPPAVGAVPRDARVIEVGVQTARTRVALRCVWR